MSRKHKLHSIKVEIIPNKVKQKAKEEMYFTA